MNIKKQNTLNLEAIPEGDEIDILNLQSKVERKIQERFDIREERAKQYNGLEPIEERNESDRNLNRNTI